MVDTGSVLHSGKLSHVKKARKHRPWDPSEPAW